MKKVNYIISFLLVVCFLISALAISSTLALHTQTTYNFHFNDGDAFKKTQPPVKPEKISGGITKYFVDVSGDDLQIYDVNGKFKDPIFDKKDQRVMRKVKQIVNIELIVGLVAAVAFLCFYKYLYSKGFKAAIRDRMKFAIPAGVVLVITRIVLVAVKSIRTRFYAEFIGVRLPKDSLVAAVYGDPFFKSYLLFSTIIAMVILGITMYLNNKMTKPERIFY